MKKFTRIETIQQTAGQRFKRQIVIKKFQTEDGKMHEFTTLLGEGSRSGAVIAITRDGKVITMHQFRPGPERWMYDLPGGGIKEDEDPETGVMRELREETGYLPGKIVFLGTSSRDAYFNCTWYYYLATECVLHTGGRQPDEEENDQGAEVVLITIDQLIEHARTDGMTDPAAVLMAYEQLKEVATDGKSN